MWLVSPPPFFSNTQTDSKYSLINVQWQLNVCFSNKHIEIKYYWIHAHCELLVGFGFFPKYTHRHKWLPLYMFTEHLKYTDRLKVLLDTCSLEIAHLFFVYSSNTHTEKKYYWIHVHCIWFICFCFYYFKYTNRKRVLLIRIHRAFFFNTQTIRTTIYMFVGNMF